MAACGVGVSHNKVCVAGFNLPRFGWGLFFSFGFFLFLFFSSFFPFRCRSQRCYLQRHIESLTGNLGVLSNDGFIKK